MKIIFFCPSVSVINGGIRHIFRMAETLLALGIDAAVFEQSGRRPDWFSSTAPIVTQGIFSAGAEHVYVLPEDQPHILADFAKLPQRKVIYSQNHFYGALGIADAESYASYGISDILCSSRSIYEHCRLRHPTVQAQIVPCVVDQDQFASQSPKKNVIAFMPRKRPIEAAYIQDMFRFAYPQHKSWEWCALSGLPSQDVARLLGDAKVFLSLSRLEGFGLAPLEAMASGCLVAGFTGIGGREYATAENGFWVNEDDFPACGKALAQAVSCSEGAVSSYNTRIAAGRATVSVYSPEAFVASVKLAWDTILQSSPAN